MEGWQSKVYETHLQEGGDDGSEDEYATKPHVYRCELGALLCLFVDAMMDEA